MPVWSARHFHEALGLELRRAGRLAHPTAVIVADLDDIAAVVQRYGRATLDFLVAAVAERARHALRDYDLVARLDDGTLGLLLPESDLEQARVIAARVADRVA